MVAKGGSEIMEKRSKRFRHKRILKFKEKLLEMGFLILLGVVLGSSIFLGTRIFANREPDFAKVPAITQRQGDPVLTINTNKEKVNQMISFFLTDYQKTKVFNINFILKMKRC